MVQAEADAYEPAAAFCDVERCPPGRGFAGDTGLVAGNRQKITATSRRAVRVRAELGAARHSAPLIKM